MRYRRSLRFLILTTLLIVLTLGSVSLARANTFKVAPLTVISGPSPFANCTIGATGTQGEILYVNAEEEPWVDVNPTNPDNLIAVWQQDRWSNGGAHGLATGVTKNGGKSWTTTYPHFSICAGGTPANGGDYERSSDPWVSFSPDGTAYQISLSVSFSSGVQGLNAVLVSKSTDGGMHWSEPITIKRDSGDRDSSYAFNDKESITADPTDSHYAYAVWDRFVTPAGTSMASIPGFFNSRSFRQPIWFARTTDGGQTWEPARKIFDPSELNGTVGNQIAVLPNGDLVNVFDFFLLVKNSHKLRGANIALIRSTDKGETWSQEIIVAKDLGRGALDPDTSKAIRAEGGIPEVAVDRHNGNLYVVWQDTRFSGVDEIALSRSTDGGLTWSAPIKVSQTPRSSVALNQQAFVPNIRVADDGTVAVTYYDFRNNDASPGVPTDYWIVHCHQSATTSCANAANWGNEARLSDTSFDIEQAPAARGPVGYFLGEYEGLTSTGNTFRPVFVQVNNGNKSNRTDVFATTVSP
jgi:hypothetical protein